MVPCRRAFQMSLIIMITSITSTVDKCFCTSEFKPVCASNGQVFSNACVLQCHNWKNNDNLKIENIGHCNNDITPTESKETIQENLLGGAADVCQFTKDYEELLNYASVAAKSNLITKKENAGKSAYYFILLAILSCIECTIMALIHMYFAKPS